MNAAETIQAAIGKLSDQRDASQRLVPGRWSNTEDGQEVTGNHGAVAESWGEEHCDLIVTLHATIDAQLEILYAGRSLFYGDFKTLRPVAVQEIALVLARAILGEQNTDA